MFLIFLLGVFLPRLAIFLFWIFTNSVIPSVLLGILGLIFLPYTLLAYTVSEYWFIGASAGLKIAFIVIGLLADFGIIGSIVRRKS